MADQPILITEIHAKIFPKAFPKPTLIPAYPNIPIREALHLLATHRITCLPLFSHGSTRIVSIINLFDIMMYIVRNLSAGDLHNDRLTTLEEPVENVLGLDTEMESYRMHLTDADEPLKKTLIAFSHGTHRTLVMSYPSSNLSESPVAPWLLTQTDIILYIHLHPECLPPGVKYDVSIDELGLVPGRKVITAKAEESALNTFQKMAENGIVGVAVLDEDGYLVGNLSASDLRGITAGTLTSLMLPIPEFLKSIMPVIKMNHCVTVTRATTLRGLIDSIVRERVHRAWIVEIVEGPDGSEKKKVLDVVTLSDLIRLLIE